MFKKENLQYAVDEERNVSLEATGPYSFLYTKGEKSVEIPSESLKAENGLYSVCIYLSALKTWDKPESIKIEAEDVLSIKNDVQDAIKILEMNAEFE